MRPTESFDRKNVTEMGLDVSELPGSRWFDAERDVSMSDLEPIIRMTFELRRNKHWWAAADHILPVHELDPDYAPILTTHEIQKLHSSLAGDRSQMNVLTFTRVAELLQTFYPQSDSVVTPDDWPMIQEAVDTFRRNNDWRHFAALGNSARALDPAYDFHLTESDQRRLRQTIDEHRRSKQWVDFARLAAFSLDHVPGLDVRLTDQDRQAMVDELDQYR